MTAALRVLTGEPIHKTLSRSGLPVDLLRWAEIVDACASKAGGREADLWQKWAAMPLTLTRAGRIPVSWGEGLACVPDLREMPTALRAAIGASQRQVVSLRWRSLRWKCLLMLAGDQRLADDDAAGRLDKALVDASGGQDAEAHEALRALLCGSPCRVPGVAALFDEGGPYALAGAVLRDGAERLAVAVQGEMAAWAEALSSMRGVEVFAVVDDEVAVLTRLGPEAVDEVAAASPQRVIVGYGPSWAGPGPTLPTAGRARGAWAEAGLRAVRGLAALDGEERRVAVVGLELAQLDRPAEVAAAGKLADGADRKVLGAVTGPVREKLRRTRERVQAAEPEQEVQDTLVRNGEGVARGCDANLSAILKTDTRWAGLKMSAMGPRMTLNGEPIDEKVLALQISEFCSRVYGLDFGQTTTQKTAVAVAYGRPYHPVQDYLNGLEWDGVERIARIVPQVLKAENTALHQAFVRRFLIGAAARALRPGCKMDTALVLVGDQGAKKSTFYRTLFGEWFGDSPIPIGNKDAFIQLACVWGYEAAEMESLNRQTAEAVKAFMSSATDLYRKPYGSVAEPVKRHAVLCGSTNLQEFLNDPTGSRRFYPIAVAADLDLEWLAEARDQLWAEAAAAFKAGEQWWLDKADDAERAKHNERFTEDDVWEGPVRLYLEWKGHKNRIWFPTDKILEEALKIEPARQDRTAQLRLGRIMRSFPGWTMGDVPIKEREGAKKAWRRPVTETTPDGPAPEPVDVY